MKHFKFLFIVVVILLFALSCKECPECKDCSQNPEYIKKENTLANVEKISGVYIFIKSEPTCAFEVLGSVKNDIADQVKDNTTGKKGVGKLIKGVFDVTKNNVDFTELLTNMVALAKKKYSNVNAVIFKDNLSNCEAVKFK